MTDEPRERRSWRGARGGRGEGLAACAGAGETATYVWFDVSFWGGVGGSMSLNKSKTIYRALTADPPREFVHR